MIYKILELNLNCDIEKNFNHALNLCEQNICHNEMINFLKTGSVAEKQIAALNLDSVLSQNEAEIFISNLTGCDGKIREAAASRLYDFVHETPFFAIYPEIFADASIDINANISRLVIDSLTAFNDNQEFKNRYLNKIIGFIKEGFDEISKIKFRDKKYVLNKQLFKIYWSLEGLSVFSESVDGKTLMHILENVLARPEYTIREKAAKILSKYKNNSSFKALYDKVLNDENFYVRFAAQSSKEGK